MHEPMYAEMSIIDSCIPGRCIGTYRCQLLGDKDSVSSCIAYGVLQCGS